MLAADPSLTGKEIAASLAVGISQLVRWFKADLRMPLVEYRNRLRLERFQVLVDAGEANLLEAARASGFGSYAQFHRVFRTVYGAAPREYLRGR
jgi:transcriptional regulator GlxA family with amidase domain